MKHHFSRLIAPPLLLSFCVWASSSQAQALTEVGSLVVPGGATGMAIKGNTLYLANFADNNLGVIDISVPSAPLSRGTTANPASRARDVVVAGNRAFVAGFGIGSSNSSAIAAFSLSSPTNPTVAGQASVTGSPTFIGANDQALCVTTTNNLTSTASLQVFDLLLAAKATVPLRANPSPPIVSGTLVFVQSNPELAIYDISNLAAPVLRHTSAISITAVGGGLGYGISGGALQVYDLSTPTAPVLRGAVPVAGGAGLGLYEYGSVVASGTTVYVAIAGSGTLQVFDAGAPATPVLLGAVPLNEYAGVFRADGSYVYVLTGGSSTRTLRVFRTQNPKGGVTNFAPASGGAGTSVTLTGTGFAGATAVRFNNVAATFSVISPTEISANVPVGAATGPITVVTPSGSTIASLLNFSVSGQPTASRTALAATDWSLYPNPAQNGFWVDMSASSAKEEFAQARLHNNLGQVVRQYALKVGSRTPVATQGLVAGVYFLRLAVGDQVAVRKIVIE